MIESEAVPCVLCGGTATVLVRVVSDGFAPLCSQCYSPVRVCWTHFDYLDPRVQRLEGVQLSSIPRITDGGLVADRAKRERWTADYYSPGPCPRCGSTDGCMHERSAK